jgi:hypothetical protein
LLFVFDPAATWWFPSCPFNALTGWLCPGDGITDVCLRGHVRPETGGD